MTLFSPTAPAKSDKLDVPMSRGLPLAVLAIVACVYAWFAIAACLTPASGVVNQAGAIVGNDFMVFYAASDLLRESLPAKVFDQAFFYARQDALSGLSVHFPWAYPPHLLLALAPLAHMPYVVALALWLAVTTLPFAFVLQRVSGLYAPLALLAPPLVQNAIDGQNGALTASLVAGGVVALAGRRSILAGALFGLLVYKPQVAVLAPICLLAVRDFRALAAFVVSAAALPLASLGLFGFDIWVKFIEHLPEHMALVTSGALPADRFPTMFISVFQHTGSETLAKAAQAVSTLAAWGFVYWVWRREDALFPRLLALAVAMPLATPFMLEYDLALWAAPGLMLAARIWRGEAALPDWPAMVALLFTPPLIWIGAQMHVNFGLFVVLALAAYTAVCALRMAPRAA